MTSLIAKTIDFLFPAQCLHCRAEGAWLCPVATKNIEDIPLVVDPLRLQDVDQVVCRGEYDHPLLRTIVQRLKYDYWTGVTEVFPSLLTPLMTKIPTQNISTAIVPVPLHWRRRLARGFNQSDYLAHSLSRLTGYPVVQLLRRRRHTTPQAKLHEQERAANIAEAFIVRKNTKLPFRVILIDDVITTGSTISACAMALRAAGVNKILAYGLVKG